MPVETAQRAISSKWFDWLARFGYATKGIVFGAVGLLAARVALGSWGEDADFMEALDRVGDQPLSTALLLVMTLGLFGYTIWRLVQGFLDISGEGTDARGLFKRGVYISIGLSYGVLAVYAATLLGGWGGTGNGNGENGEIRDLTATVMEWPLGEWLVGFVGLVLLLGGLKELHFAVTNSFRQEFEMQDLSGFEYVCVLCTGWYGHAARGLIYGALGFFALRAAVTFDPDEARGLAEGFRELAEQPFGHWIVGFIALGFMAFGVYCLLLALHRHIPNENLMEG